MDPAIEATPDVSAYLTLTDGVRLHYELFHPQDSSKGKVPPAACTLLSVHLCTLLLGQPCSMHNQPRVHKKHKQLRGCHTWHKASIFLSVSLAWSPLVT
jgi:hypothetical protein